MEFRDFNVEILATRGSRFDVRVASQASGELQTSVALARTVDELLAALLTRGASVRSAASAERVFTPVPAADAPRVDAQGADIGQTLFDMLFSEPETSRALAECMTDAKASKSGVRLKLTLNTRDQGVADLARLPWELLHDDSKYKHFALRPDFPIVRYLEVPKPFTVERFEPPLRILAVSANPRHDLALDRERENLKAALADVPDVELTFVERASIQRVADAMAQANRAGRAIHVVHYMGHGDFHRGRGVLLLHKDGGGEDPVEAEAFVTAIQAAGDVRLVFLNACNTAQSDASGASDPFSGVASSLVFEGVPAVVAMQRPVPDAAAIVLAKHFYASVAKGVPVDAAVSEGRRQMFFANRASLDWAIPVLFMRSPNGLLFDLDRPAPRRADPLPLSAPSPAPTPSPDITPLPAPTRRWSWGRRIGVGAAVVVAGLIGLVALVPPPPPPTRIVFRQFESPVIATGESTTAHVQLAADNSPISGTQLADYVVTWTATPEGIMTVVPDAPTSESRELTARITAVKPLAAGATVSITAAIDMFKLADSRQLGVKVSERDAKSLTQAYRAAGAPGADDATLLANATSFLTAWGPLVPFVDQIDALSEGERSGIKMLGEWTGRLQNAIKSFEALNGREATLPLGERIRAWKDYKNTIAAVNQTSPTIALAETTLGGLERELKSGASVEKLTMCQSEAMAGNTCARPATSYRAGDSVWFAVQWMTPSTMRGSDKLKFTFGPVDAAGQFTGTPDTRETTAESGRDLVRNWRGQFTARSAGPHELRATNGKGVYVWRERITVQ